jgi:hypothetical protein
MRQNQQVYELRQIPGRGHRAEYKEENGQTGNLIHDPRNLPARRGKRPTTLRGPLHVQCSDNGEEGLLRELVQEVGAWSNVEAGPFPIGSAEAVSFRVEEDLANDDLSIFITGREFGRVLFGAPTIYLTLPLSCAHRAVVRGWAEPHFYVSFGLVSPGVVVVYTPRDEEEMVICRSLLWMSYNFALAVRPSNCEELEYASA